MNHPGGDSPTKQMTALCELDELCIKVFDKLGFI